MTTFWIAAAGLVALAWLIVLPSLVGRRSGEPDGTGRSATLDVLREQLAQVAADGAAGRIDAEQQAAATADIERRALDEGAAASPAAPLRNAPPSLLIAVVTAVVIGAIALGLYARVGNHDALRPAPLVAAASAASGAVTLQQVEAMVDQLAQRLATDPALQNDARAWTMLARSAAALRHYDQAKSAFARAVALSPNDAQLLVDQADVLAMLQGQTLDGEPARIVDRALQLQPENIKALAMAGSHAYEHGDYAEAVRRWSTARRLVEAGSDLASGLDHSIAAAQQAAASGAAGGAATAGQAPAAGSDAASEAAAAAATRSISGQVRVAPALAGRVAADDTVFVYARAASGPRMPVAVLRRRGADLPFSFRLDDSLAMSPAMKLSTVDAVVIEARVSHTGNAMTQPGDLTTRSGILTARDAKIDLTIDAVAP